MIGSSARHRKRIRPFPALVALTFAAIATLGTVAAAARPLVLDDYYRVVTVSDPQLSPDGNWIAYSASSPDREADADASDLWLASWDGTRSVQLTSTKASEHTPRWSPDGTLIAFLSDRGDEKQGDQVWLLDRRGGEARQLSHFDGDIAGMAWAPDGKRLVLSALVPKTASDADKPAPIVIDRLQFKRDGDGYLGAARTHIFVIDALTGTTTQLTEGSFDERHPAWSPDGSEIAFFSKRGDTPDAHTNWDVYVMAARPGSPARQVTSNPGIDGDPTDEWGIALLRYDNTGTRLAHIAGGPPEDVWYSLVRVTVSRLDGGAALQPTAALDRNTVDPRWSRDGKSIYFRLEDDRSMQLARVRLSDGRIERLTDRGAVVSEFDIGRGDRIALVHGTSDRPGEISVLDAGKLRQVTHHNDALLKELTLAKAREIEFKSADGVAVHGLLLVPSDPAPASGYPAVLRLHGGPVAQYQHEFDFGWQWLVANGYAVVAPNPRGSTGRGYHYQRMLFAKWGIVDVPDVLAAVEHIVALRIADPQRVGLGGRSYGGMLTDYVVASDRRFKAAISESGIANMLASFGVDHYQVEWERELGLPWNNPALWLELSYPFLHADRITTPTLFLHGADDVNVPLVGSEQMYQALRRLGVPTQLVIYPDQYHPFARPSFTVDRWRRYVEWYDRYLKAASP